MVTSEVVYYLNDRAFHGFLAVPQGIKTPAPAVLVVHDWSGRNGFACDKARLLATQGYIGFAVDLYGQGKVGETTEEKKALMDPLTADRRALCARMQAALETLTALPEVDSTRIAAMGFCFGGLCALDLARSGAALKGIISFHGELSAPQGFAPVPIVAKMLVLHGYDDPMVTPEAVLKFCNEMTAAKVDWQVHCYGKTKHSFTNPAAHDEAMGTVYNPVADARSWASTRAFLADIF